MRNKARGRLLLAPSCFLHTLTASGACSPGQALFHHPAQPPTLVATVLAAASVSAMAPTATPSPVPSRASAVQGQWRRFRGHLRQRRSGPGRLPAA